LKKNSNFFFYFSTSPPKLVFLSMSEPMAAPKRLLPRASLHRAVRTPRTIGTTRGIVDSASWTRGGDAYGGSSGSKPRMRPGGNGNGKGPDGAAPAARKAAADDSAPPEQQVLLFSKKKGGVDTASSAKEADATGSGSSSAAFAQPRGRQHIGVHPSRPGVNSSRHCNSGMRPSGDERFLKSMEHSYGVTGLMQVTKRASGLADLARDRAAAAAASSSGSATAASSSSSSSASRGCGGGAHAPRRRPLKNFSEDLGSIRIFKEIFDDYDRDGSGDISKAELHEALIAKSPALASRFFDMFESLDRDGSGRVQFTELLHELYPQATRAQVLRMAQSVGLFRDERRGGDAERKRFTPEELSEIAAIFKLYDTDGSGTIEIAELRGLFEGISDEDLNRMLAEVDADGDSKLNLGEFAQLVG
jgi:Ca2+-binding EF-hand superfamily protein